MSAITSLSSSTSSPLLSPSAASSLSPSHASTTSTMSSTLPSASSSSSSSSAAVPHSQSTVISEFRAACLSCLHGHLCHHLIPHSGKVVVFDSELRVFDAFHALLNHDINCAPVWDHSRRKYVGMLSVSDFIDILIATYYHQQQQLLWHHQLLQQQLLQQQQLQQQQQQQQQEQSSQQQQQASKLSAIAQPLSPSSTTTSSSSSSSSSSASSVPAPASTSAQLSSSIPTSSFSSSSSTFVTSPSASPSSESSSSSSSSSVTSAPSSDASSGSFSTASSAFSPTFSAANPFPLASSSSAPSSAFVNAMSLMSLSALPSHRICDWSVIKKSRGISINRLLCVTPEATLYDAVRMLIQYRVHRLCVVQLALADTVLRILTHHGLLRFLRNNCPAFRNPNITLRQLGIGVFHENLLTVSPSTPLIHVLEMLYTYKISSIPIVDSERRPLDVYTRSDVRYLAMNQSLSINLAQPISEALIQYKHERILPIFSRDDTLYTVAGLLVSSMKHSLVCVDANGKIEGIISLTDIFSFILDEAPPNADARLIAMQQQQQLQQLDTGMTFAAHMQQQQQQQQQQQLQFSPMPDPASTSNPNPAPSPTSNEYSDSADVNASVSPDEDFLQ